MPRKTSFCNAALLRSDIMRYWPLLFLYVAVWVVILPMQILSASRECDGVAEGIMTVLQLRQHNVIIQSIPASVVMSLLFGCFAAMAVWSYLMSGRTVGLMHALPVTRTQAFFSHVLSALGALTAGNVLIFLLTALCSAGFSYVDWAALGTWLLLTELMALFFFALGSQVEKFPNTVKRAAELGCEVANHTYSHKNLTKISEDERTSQVEDTADIIESITGTRSKLVRPPYGAKNDDVRATVKYPLILWSIDTLDWKTRDTDSTVAEALKAVDGDIVLMHDVRDDTAAAAEQIIPALVEQGYKLVTVSEMFEAKGIALENGKAYRKAR